jgi:hypothetical protein
MTVSARRGDGAINLHRVGMFGPDPSEVARALGGEHPRDWRTSFAGTQVSSSAFSGE